MKSFNLVTAISCCVVALAGLLAVGTPVQAANPLPHAANAAQRAAGRAGYHYAASYQGPYRQDVVYTRAREDDHWRPGVPGRFPETLNCPDAVKQLKATGLWRGHLNKGATCGSPYEPSFWALGSRLNYDIQQAPAPVIP